MGLQVSVDLVFSFKELVSSLRPYANEQGISLNFESNIPRLYGSCNTKETIRQLSNLISRVIAYTPQYYEVNVSIAHTSLNKDIAILKVSNTGVNLARIREITNITNYKIKVIGIKNKGTIFNIEIPINKASKNFRGPEKNNLGYKPYYKEIETKLTAYFKEIESLQIKADRKGEKEGVFLRKVNAVIQLRISDHTFKVDALASAMALSRAQLFRKIKALTNMSPSTYLLYFRLHMARDLLKTKQSGVNVSEAAYSAGFLSKSHFTRSFRKQFGLTPSSYKKMQL